MKKSTTQMTKSQLLELLKEKDRIIADLNMRVDELEISSIASAATPLDASASHLLDALSQRIKSLEEALANRNE
jgi:hypothetical protein